MKPDEYGRILEDRLKGVIVAVPDRSLQASLASEILSMAGAYCSDGITFLRNADPVNALASFCYGLGWLDAGCSLGLLTGTGPCRYGGWAVSPFPEESDTKLREKTTRYKHLLSAALHGVEPAPEPESKPYSIAEKIHLICSFYSAQGSRAGARGDFPQALALYSYGHGWLDAGVRAGLFRITADRDIFAL